MVLKRALFWVGLQTWTSVPPVPVLTEEHVSTWIIASSVSVLLSGLGRPAKLVRLVHDYCCALNWNSVDFVRVTVFLHTDSRSREKKTGNDGSSYNWQQFLISLANSI